MTGFKPGSHFLLTHTSTLMYFTGVTNAHGPSPQPTACSLMAATGSNKAKVAALPTVSQPLPQLNQSLHLNGT